MNVRSRPRFQFTVNLCNLFLTQLFQSVLSLYLSSYFQTQSLSHGNSDFKQEITIFFPQKINILLDNANKIAAQPDQEY